MKRFVHVFRSYPLTFPLYHVGKVHDKPQHEVTVSCRDKLTIMSSSFAQLAHKTQTIFQMNAKLEAELISLRSGMTESQAKVKVFEKELKSTLLQLHTVQLQLHTGKSSQIAFGHSRTHFLFL